VSAPAVGRAADATARPPAVWPEADVRVRYGFPLPLWVARSRHPASPAELVGRGVSRHAALRALSRRVRAVT
jgi:hypothetical protein